jgi:hypothetical protein
MIIKNNSMDRIRARYAFAQFTSIHLPLAVTVVSYTLNLRAHGIKVNARQYRYYLCG